MWHDQPCHTRRKQSHPCRVCSGGIAAAAVAAVGGPAGEPHSMHVRARGGSAMLCCAVLCRAVPCRAVPWFVLGFGAVGYLPL
eukprot:227243-Chlamydomonas_euryale.AAC.18